MYGLVKAFARCLADKRAAEKIRHTFADLIGQRIFGIACGHPDGNDADHLADDPIHKLLLGRDPVSGAPLASQPTISRFENGATRTALYRMGRELAACVIERHRRRLHGRARLVTIDLDPTDDLTHGAQQLTFFNGHYGGWCYLPLLGFLSFDREAEQYLCAAVLRPGNAVAADGTLGLLCRLLPLLRAAFPRARFLVRLDGGFATPEVFDFLDAEPRLDYVVAMAKNAVLERHAESALQTARTQSEVSGETAHVYTDTRYAARTWGHERRVVIKAEVVRLGERAPRDNPRFVVTNLRQTPRFIYEKVYCARGDIENRIKELLDGLQIDRTSCCRFWANQLRVLLTAAAYVLMQELRLRAAGTACARTQVTWLRDRLLKLGVQVVRSVRRLVLHLPRATPQREKVYCARGDIENRIKELLDGLQIDRTSCCRFWANQLRVLLTAAAYVLMQELRLRAAGTACARTQVTWLRDRLLKLGVQVVRSVRRLVLHLPRATPQREAWQRIALALGARAG